MTLHIVLATVGIFGLYSKSIEKKLNNFYLPSNIIWFILQKDDFGCSAVEETREGKSIYRKSRQGPNAIVLATDGEILSYLSGIEMETNEQFGENLGVVLTMDPNGRIASLKSMFEKNPSGLFQLCSAPENKKSTKTKGMCPPKPVFLLFSIMIQALWSWKPLSTQPWISSRAWELLLHEYIFPWAGFCFVLFCGFYFLCKEVVEVGAKNEELGDEYLREMGKAEVVIEMSACTEQRLMAIGETEK